jgi:hypothetical protein
MTGGKEGRVPLDKIARPNVRPFVLDLDQEVLLIDNYIALAFGRNRGRIRQGLYVTRELTQNVLHEPQPGHVMVSYTPQEVLERQGRFDTVFVPVDLERPRVYIGEQYLFEERRLTDDGIMVFRLHSQSPATAELLRVGVKPNGLLRRRNGVVSG